MSTEMHDESTCKRCGVPPADCECTTKERDMADDETIPVPPTLDYGILLYRDTAGEQKAHLEGEAPLHDLIALVYNALQNLEAQRRFQLEANMRAAAPRIVTPGGAA